MNFLERRRCKKLVQQVLHEARHARHMRADVAEPADLETLRSAEEKLRATWNAKAGADELNRALESAMKAGIRVFPPRSYPRMREFVEIGVVAIAVAMGFRTFFIQPFKIPTGSMEPTLYGIKVDSETAPGLMDKPPLRYVKFITTGKRFVNIRAKSSGYVVLGKRDRKNFIVVSEADPRKSAYLSRGKRHVYQEGMTLHVTPNQFVQKGERLASGTVTAGDHIFVDKIRYNFTKPNRGQIVVFRTEAIRHPNIQTTDHYIKRLVGLPGETISVDPPHLVVNGEKITGPFPFARLLKEPYHGYELANPDYPVPPLGRPNQELVLQDNEFLPFGDNTRHSLDGRYFGGVPVRSLIGPAFAVYWPFSERWGWAR
jgi:signal peptidase I